MAGFNWNDTARLVEQQALAFLGNGLNAKLVEPSNRAIDPTAPQDGVKATEIIHSVPYVTTSVKQSDKPQPSDVSRVVRKLILGASSLPVRPRVGWKIRIDIDGQTDLTHTIIAPLGEIKPGDTAVVYTIFVER